MIQIQSSWFPLVDRNPQKFCNIYEATEADFQQALIRIHEGGKAASRIELPVVK
jgi:predicted acyl esterase